MTATLMAPPDNPAVTIPAPPPNFTVISVTAALVALTLAFLLSWKKKPLKKLEWLVPWFCLVAGIGLAPVFLRAWVQTAGELFAGVPYIGAAIPVAATIFVLFNVIYDMWPKHESTRITALCAVVLPSMSPLLGGVVGGGLSKGLNGVAYTGAQLLSTSLGV